MDIRCPQCSTLYEFDAERLRKRVVNFKCSQCSAVFKVEKPGQAPPQGSPNSEKTQPGHRWMVRTQAGDDILYFTGMQTLQKWIIDRKLSPNAEISRTGSKWKRLGDIGELSSFFQVADSIQRVKPGYQAPQAPAAAAVPIGAANAAQPQPPPQHTPPPTPLVTAPQTPLVPAPQTPLVPAPQTPLVPAPQAPPPQATKPAPSPAPTTMPPRAPDRDKADWGFGGDEAPQHAGGLDIELDDAHLDAGHQRSGSSTAIIVIIALVALIAGGLAAVYFVAPSLLGLGEASTEETNTTAATNTQENPDSDSATNSNPDQGEENTNGTNSDDDTNNNAADTTDDATDDKSNPDDQTSTKGEKTDPTPRPKNTDAEVVGNDSIDSLLRRGRRAFTSGRNPEAIKLYQKAVKVSPGNSEAHAGLGWAYLAAGNAHAALGSFRKCNQINPRYGDAYIGLGQAYRSTGNKAAALKAYESYLKIAPSGSKASIARHHQQRLSEELKPKNAPQPTPQTNGAPAPTPAPAPQTNNAPAPTPSPAPAPAPTPAPKDENKTP